MKYVSKDEILILSLRYSIDCAFAHFRACVRAVPISLSLFSLSLSLSLAYPLALARARARSLSLRAGVTCHSLRARVTCFDMYTCVPCSRPLTATISCTANKRECSAGRLYSSSSSRLPGLLVYEALSYYCSV